MSGNSEFTSQFECDERTRVCVVTLAGNFDPVAAEDCNRGFRKKSMRATGGTCSTSANSTILAVSASDYWSACTTR